MKNTVSFLALLLAIIVFSCQQKPKKIAYPQVAAPSAAVQPHEIISKHGDKRIDNYFWLRHREDSAVINYLKQENTYLDTMMAHTKGLQETLFQEMKGRIKEKDESVPYKLDNYFYYSRFEEGGEYPIFCRKKESLESPEEVLANGNELGKRHGSFSLDVSPSPNHAIAVIAVDTVGRRFYTLRFKDLLSGNMLADKIPGTAGNYEWANNSKSIFYVVQDPSTLRADKVFRHELGTDPAKDVLVFEEKDETLSCGVSKSRSKKFLLIGSDRTDASITRYMDIDKPTSKIAVIEPLKENVQYNVDHFNGKFYIHTNADATNYRLVEAAESSPAKANWKDIVPNREDIFLENFKLFNTCLAVQETFEELATIRLITWGDGKETKVDFGEPAYLASIGYNPEASSPSLRYNYQSMTTPPSQYDFDIATHEKKLLKEREVLGGFDRTQYQTERVMAPARDGVKVPLSIVYRKDKFKKDGTSPCLQYCMAPMVFQ